MARYSSYSSYSAATAALQQRYSSYSNYSSYSSSLIVPLSSIKSKHGQRSICIKYQSSKSCSASSCNKRHSIIATSVNSKPLRNRSSCLLAQLWPPT